jgi:hypothetical protein
MITSKSKFARCMVLVLVVAGFFLVTGCGTTALIYKPADSVSVFNCYQTLAIKSSAAEGVVVSDSAQERVRYLVKANIASKYCPHRFQSITTEEPSQDDLVLLINYTTYDEGNRFARLMLAGLGGIKIHSDVIVKTMASDEPISKAEIGKTFRWGGVYGATTDITEIEKWFADEVAKTFAEIIGTKRAE